MKRSLSRRETREFLLGASNEQETLELNTQTPATPRLFDCTLFPSSVPVYSSGSAMHSEFRPFLHINAMSPMSTWKCSEIRGLQFSCLDAVKVESVRQIELIACSSTSWHIPHTWVVWHCCRLKLYSCYRCASATWSTLPNLETICLVIQPTLR